MVLHRRSISLFEENEREERTSSRLLKAHRALFIRRPFLSLLASIAVYAAILLLFGERLEISSNYFVILPVVSGALSYGMTGGIVAGALGLPANLALFAILGHPEYSPANKLIAEFSGLLVGGALGYLAEYFRQLESEIRRRVQTERSLRAALKDNQLLLLELHHRVKNNINIIKSLIQLQRNRSRDPNFLEASDRLLSRVFAIARAHDRLYDEGALKEIPPEEYLRDILDIYSMDEGMGPRVDAEISAQGRRISADSAVPLGLILNEVISNALKYAFPPGAENPIVRVRFVREAARWILEVRDNGTGFDPAAPTPAGLGLKIVRGLAGQLEGAAYWSRDGGTVFRLEFPASPSSERGPITS